MTKRNCDCSSCKRRNNREFFKIVAASYRPDELKTWYRQYNKAHKLLLTGEAKNV